MQFYFFTFFSSSSAHGVQSVIKSLAEFQFSRTRKNGLKIKKPEPFASGRQIVPKRWPHGFRDITKNHDLFVLTTNNTNFHHNYLIYFQSTGSMFVNFIEINIIIEFNSIHLSEKTSDWIREENKRKQTAAIEWEKDGKKLKWNGYSIKRLNILLIFEWIF